MKEISLSYRDICFYSLAIVAIICAFCLFMIILDIAQIFFIKQFCLTAGFFIFAVSICYALFGDDTKYHDILSTIFVAGGFIVLCLSAYVCHIIELINQTSLKVVKKFKTFRDLVLRKTSKYDPTLRARLTFDNNYGISMVRDNLLKNRYEIAVLHNNELCFNTSITSDTVKGLTGREITKLMEKIQKL